MDLLKIISFSLFLLSLLIPTTTTSTCTTAVCRRGEPFIRFPFRLTSHQPQSCSYDKDFDLTCNGVNRTTITLPFSGKFTVEEIDYAAQEIWINDPNNCLPKRILELNLTTTPFSGVYSRRFTFFNCSTSNSDYLRFKPLNPITCLSDKNSTVFATASPRVMNNMSSQSCRVMKTVEVPVRWPFYEQSELYSDLSDNLWLSWRVPRCNRCEIRGGKCGIKSNSSREIVCSDPHKPAIPRKARYAIAIGAGIPGTLILFGIFCFIYTKINSYFKRRRLISNPEINNTQAHSLPSSIIIMGLDGPTIESYPKIVLGESKRLPKIYDSVCSICSICLSEYEPKETLRTIPSCRHCFHADCIDEWLKLNGTCPVCRNCPEQVLFSQNSSV